MREVMGAFSLLLIGGAITLAVTAPREEAKRLATLLKNRSWKGPKAAEAQFRLAQIYERYLKNFRRAAEAYEMVPEREKRSPFAPQALLEAAQICERRLHDEGRAKKLYERLFKEYPENLVEVEGRKTPAGQVASERLDRLHSGSLIYQLIHALVSLCGGDKSYSHALSLLLLALLVKLLLMPFARKQYEMMRKMQELQPVMKRLQEKYADDKERLHQEMFNLVRQYGLHRGCLIQILPFPILILVWTAITRYLHQFEGARFLWVKSLAKPDPILVALYIASMYFWQRLTPTDPTSAETQRLMNILFPIFFGLILLGFPAALTLYWLAYNVLDLIHRLWLVRVARGDLSVVKPRR